MSVRTSKYTHKEVSKKTTNCSQPQQKTVEHKVPHTKFNTSTSTKVHKNYFKLTLRHSGF